ncbi:MAG TPA: exodeoxyribonuclease VII large subunit [Gemmatimonadales bacterium]|jgi:exodeoxyribonuclease VII large subunit|nr:exodeoxyribonuclease VII large subunit [Gemmatimonadales bacterium]
MTLPLSLGSPTATDQVWSVSQLSASVKRLIEKHGIQLWVRGEVVQCKAYSSGHWYFTLRDAGSQVRCCMFRTNTMRAGKPPADGTEVYVLGKPALYEEKSEFQLVVSRMLPTAALGRQQQELERVRALLHQDGLFDPARKRALPTYPSLIALVTSRDGAAVHDIVTVTRKRWPGVRLLVLGARVQGEGAVEELVRALRLVNRLRRVDLCILGRGGGAREDLAAFNTEAVCRALGDVRVPTISAVGHEVDISLTDLVADVRAATPSAAAELAVPDRRDVLRLVDDLSGRLAAGLTARTRLASARLARTADRLQAAVQVGLQRRRSQTERLAVQLDALSPLRVLGRGYAVARAMDGRVLKQKADFVADLPFQLRVADGDVRARVE